MIINDLELPIARTNVAGPAADALANRKETGSLLPEVVDQAAYEQIKPELMAGLLALVTPARRRAALGVGNGRST